MYAGARKEGSGKGVQADSDDQCALHTLAQHAWVDAQCFISEDPESKYDPSSPQSKYGPYKPGGIFMI